jgi:polygalacturonase
MRIVHCSYLFFVELDDAICLKNRSRTVTYPHYCSNITVSDCRLVSPTNGFKIGTETFGDFDNIIFQNSVVEAGDPKDPLGKELASLTASSFYGDALGPEAGIAVESADGSHIHGIMIRNIVMHNVHVSYIGAGYTS